MKVKQPLVRHSSNADGPGSTNPALSMALLCRLFWKEASGRSAEGGPGTGSGVGREIHKGVQQSPEALWGGDVQHLEAAGHAEESVQLGVLARQSHDQWRRYLQNPNSESWLNAILLMCIQTRWSSTLYNAVFCFHKRSSVRTPRTLRRQVTPMYPSNCLTSQKWASPCREKSPGPTRSFPRWWRRRLWIATNTTLCGYWRNGSRISLLAVSR